jgi:hypothetical protein
MPSAWRGPSGVAHNLFCHHFCWLPPLLIPSSIVLGTLIGDGDNLGHHDMGILVEYVCTSVVSGRDVGCDISFCLNYCASFLFHVPSFDRQRLSLLVVVLVPLLAICLHLHDHHSQLLLEGVLALIWLVASELSLLLPCCQTSLNS